MTLPERYDLTIEQGATLKRWFALTYDNGQIVDLAEAGDGYTIGRLTVRDEYLGEEILTLTTANDGIDLTYQADANGAYWTGFFYCSAATTAALEPWGDGVYDFEVSDGSDVIRVMQGSAVLSPESTTIS